MRTYGLIGQSLSHSFSYRYFSDKFKKEGISDVQYLNFELPDINLFPELVQQRDLHGLNVTIPYKESVIQYLDELDQHASNIGAVNTIAFKDNQLIGYNTDWIGFLRTLPHHNFQKAAVLGSGGASKAIGYALHQMNTEVVVISRNKTSAVTQSYLWLNDHISEFDLIINCTPVGTVPNTDEMPDINAPGFNSQQTVIDLIYNPEKTKLLQLAEQKGCSIINGYPMLVEQAEASWKIWS